MHDGEVGEVAAARSSQRDVAVTMTQISCARHLKNASLKIYISKIFLARSNKL